VFHFVKIVKYEIARLNDVVGQASDLPTPMALRKSSQRHPYPSEKPKTKNPVSVNFSFFNPILIFS